MLRVNLIYVTTYHDSTWPSYFGLCSAQLCWEHESLIRWLQSWDTPPAGNQEARALHPLGQVFISKGAAPTYSPWSRALQGELDVAVALTGYHEKCRIEVWALRKAPDDISSSWHFQKFMSRALGRMTPKPSPALPPLWTASCTSLAGPIGTLASSYPHRNRNCVWHTIIYSEPRPVLSTDTQERLVRWRNSILMQSPQLEAEQKPLNEENRGHWWPGWEAWGQGSVWHGLSGVECSGNIKSLLWWEGERQTISLMGQWANI